MFNSAFSKPACLLTALMVMAASPALAVETSTKAPTITVVKAVTGPITQTALVTGTLVAREEILVSAQVDGFAIESILVEEGDRVEKGQVLARLSRDQLEASLAQSSAQLARADAAIAQAQSQIIEAEANKTQADASFKRAQTLRPEGITSGEIYDQRQAIARSASARLSVAQQSLALALADRDLARAQRQDIEIRLARTDIKAPAAGIVSRRTARIGAIASVASEPLFRIIANGDIELEADIPEQGIDVINVGQKAMIRPVSQEKEYKAYVRLISAEINKTSRLGRTRLALENSDGIVVGGFATATIEIASRTGVLIPISAVLYTASGAQIQVINSNIVETRRVKVGLKTSNQAEILEGLREGDTVVSISGTFLRNGDKVSAVETSIN